jgi:hypothetical protein
MIPEREPLKPRGAGGKVAENKLKLASGFVKKGEAMSWRKGRKTRGTSKREATDNGADRELT